VLQHPEGQGREEKGREGEEKRSYSSFSRYVPDVIFYYPAGTGTG